VKINHRSSEIFGKINLKNGKKETDILKKLNEDFSPLRTVAL
jgi:hypothetical protein